MANLIIREDGKLTSMTFNTVVDKRLKKSQLPVFSKNTDEPVTHKANLETTLKFNLTLQTSFETDSFAIVINCAAKQIDSEEDDEFNEVSLVKASYAGFYRIAESEIEDENSFKDFISRNAHTFINEDYLNLAKIVKQAYKLSSLPIRLPKQLVEVDKRLWD